ncbi:DHA2 family efflux MFS transporter permease subunit [Pendulispora albinea]|uniref:DHA2 family efflux MFS transporter permease subunit n=1 Tax=Pendulispora albinea TaxID=2741071 RepID=A0ABZ2M0L3_9BACT
MTAAVSNAGPLTQVAPARTVNKWGVAAAVSLGALLELIDTSIVNVALSDMQATLGATLSQVSWVVSSYAIANVIILPLTAWLGHRFGKKQYFLFSLLGFTFASVLCGFSTTLPMLIAARILQGLTGGGLMAKAQAILFETFPKEEQMLAQSVFGLIVISGPAIGPTLGGYLVTNVDWRWIFFVNVPVGAVAVALTMYFLPPDRAEDRVTSKIDWTAIGLLAIGLGALQAVLEEGNDEDWFESSAIVFGMVMAVVGLVAFTVRSLRSDHPVVDLRVLRYRSLWSGSLLSIVLGMTLYGALFAIPIFAQSIMQYSSQQTGMLLLPGAIASAVAMVIISKILGKVDPRIALAGGSMVLIGAVLWLASLTPDTGGHDLFWPLILRSFGTVFMFMPLNTATLGPVPTKDIGTATGFFNLTRQLGGSIGVALLSTMLSRRQQYHRAMLVEHVIPSDTFTTERVDQLTRMLMGKGMVLEEARQKALGLLDATVNKQAAVLSFSDTFWATAALLVVFLPLILLLGKPPKGAKVSAGH